MANNNFEVAVGWQRDTLEKLISLHAQHYVRELGFDNEFEAAIARDVKDAMARSLREPHKCNIISAVTNGETVGAVVVDGNESGKEHLGARFRWLFVSPSYGRLGVVPAIINEGMAFVRSNQFEKAYLTTYKGAKAARTLFRQLGFEQTTLVAPETLGASVEEEVWVWCG